MDPMEPCVDLDRSGEPWVGTFPGLGSVRVHDDGAIDVHVVPDGSNAAEPDLLREAALRYGWGEPLSLIRRGFSCIGGTAMAPKERQGGCLVVVGDTHDVQIATVSLAMRDWRALSDRLVPTLWEAQTLFAYPRTAPVLVTQRRAASSGMLGPAARVRTDAVRLDCRRLEDPLPVKAFAIVGTRLAEERAFEVLRGRERFEAAGRLMMGGVFAAEGNSAQQSRSSGEEVMSLHLRLALLPFARVRFQVGTLTDDIEALLEWWTSLALANTHGDS